MLNCSNAEDAYSGNDPSTMPLFPCFRKRNRIFINNMTRNQEAMLLAETSYVMLGPRINLVGKRSICVSDDL